MPQQTEPSANTALANILRGMMHGCDIHAETTQTIVGHAGLQLDILITATDRAPVVIEAEFMPAYTAEKEAEERLNLKVNPDGREIEAAIALRYPAALKDADDLDLELRDAQLSYCVLTAPEEDGAGDDDKDYDRFPESGWLEGSAADVAELARLVSVPQRTVNAAASALEAGIDSAVGVLNSMEKQSPVAAHEIADLLGMSEVPQTRRMACAIVANAMVFHDRIANLHSEILPLNRLWKTDTDNPQGKVTGAWDAILEINYWPIFAVARDIVNLLPSHAAAQILEHLRTTAYRINSTGANVAHDLTGRVFQRLIADRKYLATFYTLPASAALLARLAVDKLSKPPPTMESSFLRRQESSGGSGAKSSPSCPSTSDPCIDWSDPQAIANLRVGDFACGTGALLSAVYEQIATRHEQAGGNPASLHTAMMEDVLYGCDVMPSAIHITSSTLSGREPTVGFGGSRLYNMPYGRQPDGTVAIGSLELLQSSSVMTLFNTNDPAMRTGSAGEETAASVLVDVQDEAFDIVIMNPPFTRATNHGGAHTDITNPAFAAFNATRDDQTAMGTRINRLGSGTAYHGNAGIASAFTVLGHRKLKAGGVLAMVLPLASTAGLSWRKFRQMLVENYTNISVLSIAAPNINDMAFSADTALGECLVIARKLNNDETPNGRVAFVSLKRRAQGFDHAAALSGEIVKSASVREIEDGPYGGTPLMVGDEKAGEMLTAPCEIEGDTFAAVRLADSSLAQTAYALVNSRLWLPGAAEAVELKMSVLNDVSKLGLVDRDINGPAPRGPFDKVTANPTPTYPALWNHNASKEKRIICEPDSQLLVRQGMEEKAAEVWATASHAHLNRDLRFNSQPLGACFTERQSIGGRAWPNVTFGDERFDYAFVVWCNSTLGSLSYWWHASLQDSGRGVVTIRSAETLPILDFRTLTDDQLAIAKDIFDDFRDRDLMPAYLADADPNRAHLDKRVICDLLGFDHSIYEAVRYLAAKWCAEPSVHGGKRRPRGARLVV